MAPNAAGRVAAKALGIKLDNRNEHHDPVGAGHGVNAYEERDITVAEWFSRFKPSASGFKRYIISLFPFWNWIFHYNFTWLAGDVIAGVTVGFVVIPQGMAYALLAKLPAEYGLYTSFVGFLLYWAFATSKDITIGTVAVMSTIVGNIVIKVQKKHPKMPAPAIASALAVISGAVLLFIGLIRMGWIVEFIPLVAITSFMTGAAFSIGVGQVPGLLGIPGINTREATYKVIINTLKNLGKSKLDAAMGLSALFLLYGIRILCSFMTKKQPNKKKVWFFLSTLRMAFVIVLYIGISYGVNKNVKVASKAKFKILGKVPRGFQHAGAPDMSPSILKAIAPDLPLTIIVLILEHIAISKSFGRINNYTINPSQELVAVGFTNLFGPFLGAYPATGSFSRTAIKSKAGVRTPLAGIFTAIIVLLALYALTAVFFYIPSATLSAVIIHAVGDLITPPAIVYQYWETSPLEVLIFFGGVFLTIFTNIENGIYLTMCSSLALLLWRHILSRGSFLGRVRIYRSTPESVNQAGGAYGPGGDRIPREAYLPVSHKDGSNPGINFDTPYPGVFIYRFSEGFTYLNQQRYLDAIVEHVQLVARPTKLDRFAKIGDRPWNDPGPRRGKPLNLEDDRPILRAIILDFSSVNNLDVTSVQGLVDVRHQLDRYAAPEYVEWHFASVYSRWAKRALTANGFGYATTERVNARAHWSPVLSYTASGEVKNEPRTKPTDIESPDGISRIGGEKESFPSEVTTVHGQNRPFFHVDIPAAVEAVVAGIETKLAHSSTGTSEEGETVHLPEKLA